MIRGLREILPDNGKAFSSILISLKTRNFRLYFTGMCVSLTGTWMQQIAMSWLVYRLTGSVFLLATVTFMAQIPILLITPLMSVFVDRIDRQKIKSGYLALNPILPDTHYRASVEIYSV